MSPMSGQLSNNLEIRTFPMNPVPPVTRTFIRPSSTTPAGGVRAAFPRSMSPRVPILQPGQRRKTRSTYSPWLISPAVTSISSDTDSRLGHPAFDHAVDQCVVDVTAIRCQQAAGAQHCDDVDRFLVVGGPIHAVSLSPHHDAGVERGFVTVTLPHCPMAREKRSLATVSSCLMDKIE